MGKFVGEQVVTAINADVAEPPADAGDKPFQQFSAYLNQTAADNLEGMRQELRQMMTAKVGVFRHETGLNAAIEGIQALKQRAAGAAISTASLKMNQELVQRWELDNLLEIAMVIARGAQRRRETRGGHARSDYPERRDKFNHHTLAYLNDRGRITFVEREVDMRIYQENGENYEKFGRIERKY